MAEPPDNLPAKRPAPPQSPPPSGANRDGLDEQQIRQIALVGGLVLVASLVLVFIIENSRQVKVSFVFFSTEMSLIWVIVFSAIAGAGAGWLIMRAVRRRFGKG